MLVKNARVRNGVLAGNPPPRERSIEVFLRRRRRRSDFTTAPIHYCRAIVCVVILSRAADTASYACRLGFVNGD